jgi:3-isopropylmalate dehydrogenase
MRARIALLPGDGIGPEVVQSARYILTLIADAYNHQFEMDSYLIGGCAIDARGNALPDDTLEACRQADAILLGAVGGTKWDDPTATVRPEQGLLGLRKELELFANLRPVSLQPDLIAASPLRPELLAGVDFVVVRELTGGIYFGEPRLRRQIDGQTQAVDTMVYSEGEIRRVAVTAFQLARQRRGKLTSVDKANVLESSRLWRQTVSAVAEDYPDVTLEHLLVDAAAMFLITRPAQFDVILTGNMFGDILTDEASVLSGSMGNMPSASFGASHNNLGHPRGLYEPIHGSAPDIAGQGLANPIGTLLSAAMMLRHSFGLAEEAKAIETAVKETLSAGFRTTDLATPGHPVLNTEQITAEIASRTADGFITDN